MLEILNHELLPLTSYNIDEQFIEYKNRIIAFTK